MFTVYPQIKQEGKNTLPPLSQIMNNVLPYHEAQPQNMVYLHQSQILPQQIPVKMERPYSIPSSTPASSISSSSPSISPASSSPSNSSLPHYNKCTCKQDGNHIPRPRNAFILFRQQHH